MVFETPKERVELLKVGITGKTVERLYVVENGFRIARVPPSLELVEIPDTYNRK